MSDIFVGGAPRTGTTLAQLLLCQAAGASPFLSEASYLRMLVALYPLARDRGYCPLEYFESPEDLRRFHGSMVRRFLDHTRRRFPGCDRLVLKEPPLTMYFPALDQLLGADAQLVCMVRDPRDVVASLLKVADREAAMGGEPMAGDRVRAFCEYYRSFYAPLLLAGPAFLKRVIFVSYRELVLTPGRVIEALERRLGLDLSRARQGTELNGGGIDFSDPVWGTPWHSDLWGKPISTERLGAYRSVLRPDEVRTIEADLKDLFETFRIPMQEAAGGQIPLAS